MTDARSPEVQAKLALIRDALERHRLGAVRLRGIEAFAWATAGGDAAVLHTVETGVAEILVTPGEAFVLTDAIEAERLGDEEVPADLEVWSAPWADAHAREAFVREAAGGRAVASDRPAGAEVPLPPDVVAARRRLLPAEIERYRALGRDAAEAMTEALIGARPGMTEFDLAGRASAALWARGVHPALVLAAGDARVARYRHPIPSDARLGDRAMLVFCARRHGLFANLTRWVYFRAPTADERRADADVRAVETEAFRLTRPGVLLSDVYAALAAAYDEAGRPGEILRHHQGGTTGYAAREVVAAPHTRTAVEASTALAWNPSVPGAKVEDTVLLTSRGLDVLTVDEVWPSVRGESGLLRPALLVRP